MHWKSNIIYMISIAGVRDYGSLSEFNDFGVFFDSLLSFCSHTKYIPSKTKSVLELIRGKTSHFSDTIRRP